MGTATLTAPVTITEDSDLTQTYSPKLYKFNSALAVAWFFSSLLIAVLGIGGSVLYGHANIVR